MKNTTILLAGAAAIAIAAPAAARDGQPYLGIEGGVSFKDKVTVDADNIPANGILQPTATARTKMGVDGDVVLGYDFGPVRLEAEGGYKRNNYRGLTVLNGALLPAGVTVAPGTVVQNERDLEIWSGMVNALLDIGSSDGLQVYGGGGAGFANLRLPVRVAGVGDIINDNKTDFAWQLIGGVRFPVTDSLDLGVKYRYFNVDDFRLRAVNGRDIEASYSAHSVLASVTLNFGGRSQPEPVSAPPPPPPVQAPPPPPRAACNTGPYIVFFDFDRSDITPEAAGILNNAATAYANCGTARVMLAGHTDRAGSTQYNQALAERRNNAVRGYIASRGVPDAAITAQAFGESQPRVPTADGVREPQNRRVEVTYGPGSGM
jgi:outer membrane protein OmpA-like peptidoglycan-associated protein